MSEQVSEKKPKKPLYKRWWVWLLAVVVFIIIVSAANSSPKESVPAASDTPDTAQAGQQAVKPSAAMQTLLSLSGSGAKSTQKFTAAKDWDLAWSYDCSALGPQGVFDVYVYDGNGTISLKNSRVSQLGKSGEGVEHYHNGGEYYLQVNSACKWTMEVKG